MKTLHRLLAIVLVNICLSAPISFAGDGNLENIDGHLKPTVDALKKAESEGYSVSITEGGVAGDTRGKISNIRIEDGNLKFDVDGHPYEPFYGIKIKPLATYSDPQAILAHVDSYQKETVETLLKAQAEGHVVSIREGGVAGDEKGKITDVRLDDGKLYFKIDGRNYSPFHGIHIKTLSSDSNADSILARVSPHQKVTAEALLKAQKEGYSISITEGGVIGDRRGKVTDVELVEGKIVFKLDGERDVPFHSISIKPLVTYSDSNSILAHVDSLHRSAVTELIKSQAEGHSVSINQPGVRGDRRGQVSDLVLADGKISFKIDGRAFSPFSSFSVKSLATKVVTNDSSRASALTRKIYEALRAEGATTKQIVAAIEELHSQIHSMNAAPRLNPAIVGELKALASQEAFKGEDKKGHSIDLETVKATLTTLAEDAR